MKQEEEIQSKQKKNSRKRSFFSIFWKVCVLLLILVIAAVSIAIVKLDSILKFSLEKAGSFVTQTPVTVEKIQLKLLEGKLIISNLAVANPRGYDIPHAMAIQEVFVYLDVKSLLSPEIHVKEVKLDGAEVSYVASSLTTNNISEIYQNIQRLIPAKDPNAPRQPENEDRKKAKETGKKVIIDQVNITNTKFALGATLFGGSSLNLSISDIHLADLGKEKEMSTTEAIAQIFDEFFSGVNGVVNIAGKMVDDTKQALKETTRVFKKFFRKNKDKQKAHPIVEPAPAVKTEPAPSPAGAPITVETQTQPAVQQ